MRFLPALWMAPVLLLGLTGRLAAFDPALTGALLDDDPGVRQRAYLQAASLSVPDKINLAPSLANRLEDPAAGERAAMALSELGDPAVPYLDRHARTSYPGAEFAAMGLLAGGDAAHAAMAGILRNGDRDAIVRALAVIGASGTMPEIVGKEVQVIADDRDSRLAGAARAALAAVQEAAQRPAPRPVDEAALMKMIESAVSEAGLGAPPSDPAAPPSIEASPDEKFKHMEIDTSEYGTRQPASSRFGKNRPQ